MLAHLLRCIIGLAAVTTMAVTSALSFAAPPGDRQHIALPNKTYIAAVPKNFPPYYIDNHDGTVGGFAIETMNAIAKRAGIRIEYRVFENWGDITAAVRSKEATLIPNMGITPSQKGYFDFTQPLEEFTISFFAAHETMDKYLDDVPRTTMIGTSVTNPATEYLAQAGFTNVKEYAQPENVIYALRNERIQLLALPEPVAIRLLKTMGLADRILPVGAPLAVTSRAIAVSKGHGTLVKRLDDAVGAYIQTPEYEAVYRKWFASTQHNWSMLELILIAAGLVLAAMVSMWLWFYVTERARAHSTREQFVEQSSNISQLRQGIAMLASIMVLITALSVFAGLYMQYTAALKQLRVTLLETITSEIALINNLSAGPQIVAHKPHAFARNQMIEDIKNIKNRRLGIGEYTIAEEHDGKIHFLLRQHYWNKADPGMISLSSGLAEPMRLALAGKTGTVIGPDYRGETVVAAYGYVNLLNVGIALQVDLHELQRPYVAAGLRASAIAFAFVMAGLFLHVRLGAPIIHKTQIHDALFRGIMDNAQPIVFVRDTNGNMVTANASYREMFGQAQENLLDPPEVQHPDAEAMKRFRDQEKHVIQTMAPVDIEETITIHGQERDFVTTKFPLFFPNGEIKAVGTIAIDVTEQHSAERALLESEARFDAAFEQAAVGISLTDEETRFIRANSRFCALVGYDIDELRNLTGFDITPADEREQERVYRRDLINDFAQTITREKRYVRKDGALTWVRISSSPVRDEYGNFLYFINIVEDFNTQVQGREEIARQRDRFRRYLDITGTMVIVLDRDGNIDLINKFGCALLGYEEQELLGRNWFDIAIPRDLRDEVRRIAAQILSGELEGVGHFENEIITRTNDRRLIAWDNTYLYDGNGNVVSTLSSGTDITETRRYERALKRTNKALRAISKCNEVLVHAKNEEQLLNDVCRTIVEETDMRLAWVAFIRNKDGTRRFVPVAKFGGEKDIIDMLMPDINALDMLHALTPITYKDLATAKDLPSAQQAVERGLGTLSILPLHSEGEPFGGLFIMTSDIDADYEQTSDILRELSEDLSFGIAALRNERDRVRAEHDRAAIETQARTFIENATDAIISADTKGRIVQFNPAAERMFALPREKAVGHPLSETLVPERHREAHLRGFTAFIESDRQSISGKHFELIGLRNDGTEFPIELTLSVMPSDTGEVCSAVIRDISDRKEAERQRRQAQNMESLGNMAGGIAHDINNMLLPILSLTDMVKNHLPEQSNEREKLARVLQAANRIGGLVGSILSFSRQNEPLFRDVDIHDVVSEALNLIEPTTLSTTKITKSLHRLDGCIYADAGQIASALINLVNNASDAFEGRIGHVEIKLDKSRLSDALLSAHVDFPNGDYAMISVIDDGPGIPEDVRARVFDPFFTTKSPGKGTGLGLSMVHGIITEHGGLVDLTSAPDKGTQVDLYLPLKANPPNRGSTS